jgi:hypothetical protein
MPRRVLALIATVVMGASLIFTWSTSAHNIDLAKAREAIREYARGVRNEPGRGYVHYSTDCQKMFPGHNHRVRCVVSYQNEKDSAAGVYTCREAIEVLMPPHSSSSPELYLLAARHTSANTCGSRRLDATRVG